MSIVVYKSHLITDPLIKHELSAASCGARSISLTLTLPAKKLYILNIYNVKKCISIIVVDILRK